ncbi:MAG: LLM class F420-dependent oxidoreductase [Acidimicrobiia bacterium]|nr:MAG: LLM class F420-dependent oxidoreductase [Acidimicrobiia bacterium]
MNTVVVPYWQDRPPEEAIAVAENAARFGCSELWMGELHHFDAFALAGYLAAATRDLTLCVGPLPVGVRDPVTLARGVASVARLGSRPARLALGSANPTIVEGFHGRSWADPVSRIEEAVNAVRVLLEGGRYRGYRSALAPQECHITVAGFGPRVLDLAARIADRVVFNLVTVEQAARLARRVVEIATSAGRPVPGLAAWVVAAVDPGSATRDQVAAQLARYLAAPGYRDLLAEAGFGEAVARARAGEPLGRIRELLDEPTLSQVVAWGSEDQVRSRLDAYREVGVEPAVLPATADDPGGLRTLRALAI